MMVTFDCLLGRNSLAVMASTIKGSCKITKIVELLAHLFDNTAVNLGLSYEITAANKDCRWGRKSWPHLF